MKIIISMPNSLFEAVESAARRLGISRNRFYERAIARLADRGRDRSVRETLDAVHDGTRNFEIDPLIKAASNQVIMNNNW